MLDLARYKYINLLSTPVCLYDYFFLSSYPDGLAGGAGAPGDWSKMACGICGKQDTHLVSKETRKTAF